jgi:hypothetical protein
MEIEQLKESWHERRWGVTGDANVWIASTRRNGIVISTSGPTWQLHRAGWLTRKLRGIASDGETLELRGRSLRVGAVLYEWKRAWSRPRRSWLRDGSAIVAFADRGRAVEAEILDAALERATAELLALLGHDVWRQERAETAAAAVTIVVAG